MPTLAEMFAQSRAKQNERKQLEEKYKNYVEKAYPLPASEVILPPTKIKSSPIIACATSETNETPALSKSNDSISPKSFANILNSKQSKSTPKNAKKSGRDVLFGTGLTKKLVKKQETDIAAAETADPKDAIRKLLLKTKENLPAVPEQPPVLSLKEKLPEQSGIQWDDYQLKALHGIRNQQFSCLIGAAGTGKTTVTKQLVYELEKFVPTIDLNKTRLVHADKPDFNVAICFCAFTGRATQQMKRALPEAYHSLCQTIHATLGYAPTKEPWLNPETQAWEDKLIFRPTFTAANKLPFQICVIDEAGMVPIQLWNELLAALPKSAKIILIGDINQLPPPQGRSVLGFAMINWPTFTLEHIHRQAADNPIIANAHKILHGQFPVKEPNKFAMFQLKDGSTAAFNQIIGYIQELHKRKLFDPLQDALIVPQNKETLGQININERLITYFNGEKRDENGAILNKRIIITTGYTHVAYAVGDKVMLLQNDRKRNLTNGMTGVIVDISPNGMFSAKRATHNFEKFEGNLDVSDFDDHLQSAEQELLEQEGAEEKDPAQRQASHIVTVEFSFKKFGEKTASQETQVTFSTAGQYNTLTYAYALTCHKSQGGEYRHVVIVCHASNIRMLTREWLYTAVTRAQEKVILLYNDRGLSQAIYAQRIKGSTIKEKAEKFLALQDKTDTQVPKLPAPKEV